MEFSTFAGVVYEFVGCLLALCSAYRVFPFAQSEVKDKNIQSNDLACYFYGCETCSLTLKKNMHRNKVDIVREKVA
jgi:hypothetical protein